MFKTITSFNNLEDAIRTFNINGMELGTLSDWANENSTLVEKIVDRESVLPNTIIRSWSSEDKAKLYAEKLIKITGELSTVEIVKGP